MSSFFALTCGRLSGDLGYLMESGEGRADLPIPAYLIEHPKGTALFDTGMHPDCQRDPATRVGTRREWEAGMDPESAALRGFNRADFDLGHKVIQIDGEHDLFGDSSVVCLPTYGHTPGHQSLRVRLPSGDVVLAADACYFCRTLRERRFPQRVYDQEAMFASLDKPARLEAAGAGVFFGDDGEFWKGVPQAPAAII